MSRPASAVELDEAVAEYLRHAPWVVQHRNPTWRRPGANPPMFNASLIVATERGGCEHEEMTGPWCASRILARLALAEMLRAAAKTGARRREAYQPPAVTPVAGRAEDLRALGLAMMPDAATLRRAWRKTAKRVHPDAGGTHVGFIAARAAYERLSREVHP